MLKTVFIRKSLLCGLAVWTALSLPSIVRAQEADTALVAQEAERGFKKIIAFWKDEQYEALYGEGRLDSQRLISKQDFTRLMQESHVRLQCCWATVQDLKGIFRSLSQVYVKAKIGYEYFLSRSSDPIASNTHRLTATSVFKEETFVLHREEGRWRIDLGDILAASGYILEDLPFLKESK